MRVVAVDEVPDLLVSIRWLASLFLALLGDELVDSGATTDRKGNFASALTLPAERTAVAAGRRVATHGTLALNHPLVEVRTDEIVQAYGLDSWRCSLLQRAS